MMLVSSLVDMIRQWRGQVVAVVIFGHRTMLVMTYDSFLYNLGTCKWPMFNYLKMWRAFMGKAQLYECQEQLDVWKWCDAGQCLLIAPHVCAAHAPCQAYQSFLFYIGEQDESRVTSRITNEPRG